MAATTNADVIIIVTTVAFSREARECILVRRLHRIATETVTGIMTENAAGSMTAVAGLLKWKKTDVTTDFTEQTTKKEQAITACSYHLKVVR